MRLKKKVLSLLLALCVLPALCPVFGFAAGEDSSGASRESPKVSVACPYDQILAEPEAPLAEEVWRDGVFRGGVYEPHYAQMDSGHQMIYDGILGAFSRITDKATVDLPSEAEPVFAPNSQGGTDWDEIFSWCNSNFWPVLYQVVRDHPELCWLLGGYTYTVNTRDASGGVRLDKVNVNIDYPWTPDSLWRRPQSFTQGIDRALSAIGDPKPSRAATARAIHDFICGQVVYSQDRKNVPDSNGGYREVCYDQTAYNALAAPHKVVCNGYTAAFKLLCDRYGIPCLHISGMTYNPDGSEYGFHAWNYIQLEDGKWYAVDSTWDDGNKISYDYFLIGAQTRTRYGMAFLDEHEFDGEKEYFSVSPLLNRSSYPYLEAASFSGTESAVYGEILRFQTGQLQNIAGSRVSSGRVLLCETGSSQNLASGNASRNGVNLSYSTVLKRLDPGEHEVYLKYNGGNFSGAILGSCKVEIAPAVLTASVDQSSPLSAKDFDGGDSFPDVPLVLEGVQPEDRGLVTAGASGRAASAQAGAQDFQADEVRLEGAVRDFYQLEGPVGGQVTIRKIEPRLSLSVFPQNPAPGQEATVTARLSNPQGGFPDVSQVSIMDPQGAALPLSQEVSSGVYTARWVLPKSVSAGSQVSLTGRIQGAANYLDAEASVSFKVSDSEKPAVQFSDVPAGAWYADEVAWVCENGLMNGTSAGRFSPSGTTTRGMIATILYRMADSPAAGSGGFRDVPAGKWYAPAVGWASENQVVTGYGDGTFRPENPITREQLAVMLYRYAGSPSAPADALQGFADADQTGAYAREAMSWAVHEGILTGSKDRLNPQDQATRAQTAAILMRCSQLLEEGRDAA